MNSPRRQALGVLVSLAFALLTGACTSLKVQHVTDPDANLGALKTFVIEPNKQETLTGRMLMGKPLPEAIEQSIAKAFEERGRTPAAAGQAQMIVRWDGKIEYSEDTGNTGSTRMDLRKSFASQDYVYDAGKSGRTPYLVTNVTVAIDIQNAQTRKSIWRGLISGVAKEKASDPDRQKHLDQALAKLFKSIPAE